MPDTANNMAAISQPGHAPGSILKRALIKFVKPIAKRIYDRIARGDRARLEALAEQIRVGERNLAERLDEVDTRWKLMHSVEERLNALANSELSEINPRFDALIWGREALVHRMNFVDAREEVFRSKIDSRLDQLDAKLRSLEGYGIVEMSDKDAADIDALALSRRLASLEDHVERLLQHLENSPATPLRAFDPQNHVKEAS